ncbi:MAG: hypothetical protein HYS13_06965 [Planctomycetia bacterium]|nr:hypothetical protein [Planctomycetia bacterium]
MLKAKARHTISDVLRQAIRDSGVPIVRIARDAGVSRQRIMHFLRGRQSFHLESAEKLVAYLGLKVVNAGIAHGGQRGTRRVPTPSGKHPRAVRTMVLGRGVERTISGFLRDVIHVSGMPLMWIEREAGVSRTRIGRFLGGKERLMLSSADKLATYFGLELVAPTGTADSEPTRSRADTFIAQMLLAAKQLAEIAGGIDRAREAVEWVERLR